MAPKVQPNDPGTGTPVPTQDATAVTATDLVTTDLSAVEEDEATSEAVPAG
jgi:hypothetical protein